NDSSTKFFRYLYVFNFIEISINILIILLSKLVITSTASLPTSSEKKIPTKENDFIDFFASIEQEHTVIFGNQYYQNAGTNILETNSLGYSTTTNPFSAMQNQGIQSPIQQDLNQQTPQPIS